MSDYTPVTKTSSIKEGRGKSFTVNGRRVAILNENGKFCAVDNTCPHAMGSLVEEEYEMELSFVLFTDTLTIQRPANVRRTHDLKSELTP